MDLKTLTKNRIFSYIVATVCLCFGICFCVVSETMLSIFETAICFVLIGYGAFNLVVYCLVDSDSKQRTAVFKGVFAVLVGLLIIFVKAFFMIAIGFIIGAISVLRIIRASKMKELKMKNWLPLLIISILLLTASIVLIVLSICAISKITLMILVGVVLCVQGLYDLTMLIVEDKNKNKATLSSQATSEPVKNETFEQEVNRPESIEQNIVKLEVAEEVQEPKVEE